MYNRADNNKLKFCFGNSDGLLTKLDTMISEKKDNRQKLIERQKKLNEESNMVPK